MFRKSAKNAKHRKKITVKFNHATEINPSMWQQMQTIGSQMKHASNHTLRNMAVTFHIKLPQ